MKFFKKRTVEEETTIGSDREASKKTASLTLKAHKEIVKKKSLISNSVATKPTDVCISTPSTVNEEFVINENKHSQNFLSNNIESANEREPSNVASMEPKSTSASIDTNQVHESSVPIVMPVKDSVNTKLEEIALDILASAIKIKPPEADLNNSIILGELQFPKSSFELDNAGFIDVYSNKAANVTRDLLMVMKELENSANITPENNFPLLCKVQKSNSKYRSTVQKFMNEVKASIKKYDNYYTQTTVRNELAQYLEKNLIPPTFLPFPSSGSGSGSHVSSNFENLTKLHVFLPFLVEFFKLEEYVNDEHFNEVLENLENLENANIFMFHGLEAKKKEFNVSSAEICYDFSLDSEGNIIDEIYPNEKLLKIDAGNNKTDVDVGLQTGEIKKYQVS